VKKIIVVLFLCLQIVHAHKLGENYLHVNQNEKGVSIEFEVETRLLETPDIDDNHNEIISYKELYNHQKKLMDIIEKDVRFYDDGTPLSFADAPMKLYRYKTQTYMKIKKDFLHVNISDLRLHYTLFFDKEKTHKLLIVLKNKEVVLDDTHRDFDFSSLYMTQWQRLWMYIKEGIFHILDGTDHLLFILMLLIAVLLREGGTSKSVLISLLKIITTFSVAHSITLFIAGSGLYIPNTTFIESTIAFSILFVAVMNLLRQYTHVGYGIVFMFGLVHGFGFANVLEIANIQSKSSFFVALFGFNLGVEFGQIGVVLVVLPFLFLLLRQKYAQKGFFIIELLSAFMALIWLLERVGLVDLGKVFV